jgi:hypothetical protein
MLEYQIKFKPNSLLNIKKIINNYYLITIEVFLN